MRILAICSVTLPFITNFSTTLSAQAAAAPTAYTVTQSGGMAGPGATIKIYRNGSKAILDRTSSGSHSRTLYDLQSHQSFSWAITGGPADSSAPCSSGTFSGSWGDPFEDSANLSSELTKANAKQTGTETLHGFSTKVFEAESSGNKIKVWIDTKYNLPVKMQMTPPGATAAVVMTDITELNAAPPPASIFALPSGCAAAAAAPRPPTEAERIVTETGGPASDFANATMPPGPKPPGAPFLCSVVFRVVRASSMQPITSGFQVAIDQPWDTDHPPAHTIGVNSQGHSTFAGGNLKELTSQLRNGVLRIDQAATKFDVELVFTKGESSSAVIYRQCVAPQTVLLYVVKNPDKLSEGGDWLWVKSGKWATVTQ